MQPSQSYSTQRGKILALLIAARGDWVPLPAIMACAAQYAARILELRRAGFPIPTPRVETINGRRHTWYRLIQGQAAPVSAPHPQLADVQEFSLFSLEARHRDDG
jgi:hypothetical protein